MSSIKINELDTTSVELLANSESYMTELIDSDMSNISGGLKWFDKVKDKIKDKIRGRIRFPYPRHRYPWWHRLPLI